MEKRRVVVTGMGLVCPVGNTIEEAWQNLVKGHSGVGIIQRFDQKTLDQLEVKIAGEVKNFDAKAIFGHREARRMDRVTQFAVYATGQALRHSGLDLSKEDPFEVGCIIGSGIGGIETLIDQVAAATEKGFRFVSPLMVPMMLPDSPTGRVAIEFGVRGPNMGISTACATGNNTIGEAAEIIRRFGADVMIAGGAEASIVPLAISGFNNMTTLSRRNDDPQAASRPFDGERDGFVMAEGAGILILEALEHAQARGATIYGEILGYGNTDDAYHITAPMERGEGAQASMRKALKSANLSVGDIHYINAHGTGTQLNDSSETHAIKSVWGEKAYNVKISSTKSMTGHMLGAGGSVEAIFSILSILHQFVPPTINLTHADPDCNLDYTPNVGTSHPITNVMSNAFGFGGHNAVLIFGKYQANGTK